jgi:hypothetical protein
MLMTTITLAERKLARDVKITRTIREKPMYIAMQNEVEFEKNMIYEDETQTRQELLNIAAPYFTKLLMRFTIPKEFNVITEKYPLWVENVFTRNTIRSNMQYMEYMTCSRLWRINEWDTPYFNYFCEKLHLDFCKVLMACEIKGDDLETLRSIVKKVSIENQHNIYEIGNWFGYTQDDKGSDEMY